MPHANCGRKDCDHPVVACAQTPNVIATHKCMTASVVARPGFACAAANQKATSCEADQVVGLVVVVVVVVGVVIVMVVVVVIIK